MNYLILVRHGESRWNLSNKFTGWVDVPLSERGIGEALAAAKELAGFKLDEAYTSELTRAQETLLLILARQNRTGIFMHEDEPESAWMKYSEKIDRTEIPIRADHALNERYYGRLQGMNKDRARERFGEARVLAWRRGFADRPPGGESLRDVCGRVVPYFRRRIMAGIRAGKNVIVAAHGNSLRAAIKYIEGISDENIARLELHPAEPVVYGYRNGRLARRFVVPTYDRPILWKIPGGRRKRG